MFRNLAYELWTRYYMYWFKYLCNLQYQKGIWCLSINALMKDIFFFSKYILIYNVINTTELYIILLSVNTPTIFVEQRTNITGVGDFTHLISKRR
jgi:hypothetical protein